VIFQTPSKYLGRHYRVTINGTNFKAMLQAPA
jgi:hypothetical protein